MQQYGDAGCIQPGRACKQDVSVLACQSCSSKAGLLQDPLSCDLMASLDALDANSYMMKQCSSGYYGPACSLCVRNSTHSYGRTGTAKCQQCKSKGWIIMSYAASTTLVLLFLCYTVHTTLVENAQDPALAGSVSSVKASDLLRVISSIPLTDSRVLVHLLYLNLIFTAISWLIGLKIFNMCSVCTYVGIYNCISSGGACCVYTSRL